MVTKINEKEIEALFEAGVHLGHKKNRLHPKAKKYVYQMVNGSAVIDLTYTYQMLETAKQLLRSAKKDGKNILVVATKRLASKIASDYCSSHNIPYITTKWLPGLLTNFDTLKKNVSRFIELERAREVGEWESFVKHERTKLERELNRLRRLYAGIKSVTRIPDYVVIVDLKKEKNAHKESKMNGIPVIAITDTNANPNSVEYPIVGNDDSASSVECLLHRLLDAYVQEEVK